jgi:hypothetical protein
VFLLKLLGTTAEFRNVTTKRLEVNQWESFAVEYLAEKWHPLPRSMNQLNATLYQDDILSPKDIVRAQVFHFKNVIYFV